MQARERWDILTFTEDLGVTGTYTDPEKDPKGSENEVQADHG